MSSVLELIMTKMLNGGRESIKAIAVLIQRVFNKSSGERSLYGLYKETILEGGLFI